MATEEFRIGGRRAGQWPRRSTCGGQCQMRHFADRARSSGRKVAAALALNIAIPKNDKGLLKKSFELAMSLFETPAT